MKQHENTVKQFFDHWLQQEIRPDQIADIEKNSKDSLDWRCRYYGSGLLRNNEFRENVNLSERVV